MGFFSGFRRCRRCGQFAAGGSHSCPHGRGAAPTTAPSLPISKRAQEISLWEGLSEVAARFEATRPSEVFTVWDHRPGRRGQTLVLPRPTEFSDEMKQVFARGHCHSLALALAERGYQVAGVVSVHTEKEFVPHKTSHYYAFDPSEPEFGIDIYGRRTVNEILAQYPQSRSYAIKNPERAIQRSVDAGTYLPADIEAGRIAAEWVLGPRV